MAEEIKKRNWLIIKEYNFEASITGSVDHILVSLVPDPGICPCPRGDKFSVHMTENPYNEWTRIPQ